MQVSSIPYDSFTSRSMAFVGDGGQWEFDNHTLATRPMTFTAETEHYDGASLCGASACLCMDGACSTDGCDSAFFSLLGNVSVDTTKYGNANSLSFNWTYWPHFVYTPTRDAGSSVPIYLAIGDQKIQDQVSVASNSSGGHPWDGSPISHQGNVTLVKDGSTGYIPINITFSMSSPPSNTGIVLLFANIAFEITQQLSSSDSDSDPGGPLSKSGNNIKVIVPSAVFGALALILLVFGIVLLRKRRQRNRGAILKEKPPFVISAPSKSEEAAGEPPDTATSLDPLTFQSQSYYAPYDPPNFSPPNTGNTMDGTPPFSPSPNTNYHNLPVSQYTTAPSVFSSATYATAPPSYPQTTFAYQSSPLLPISTPRSASKARSRRTANTLEARMPGPTLAEFANENRDLVPEELESKLMKVGYLPGDNPEVIPLEEWISLYGVSRVEFVRIQQFHERWKATVKAQDASNTQ